MLKLYKIELKGVRAGELSKSCSPGTTYVVAPSMDTAHMALINAYKSTVDLKDLEIDNLEIIASEETSVNSPNFYKLAVFGNIVYSTTKKDSDKVENKNKTEKDDKSNKKRGRKPKQNKDIEKENEENNDEQ
jgi:hypothetical protein